jgi:Flp pilus assembly protein TadG
MTPDAALFLTRRFAADSRGVSAVEFALVLPLMITLLLGGTEVTQAITASRKVTIISRTVADLASQSAAISTTSMTSILDASATIIAPFPSVDVKVVVSCVTIDASKVAKVTWSDGTAGAAKHQPGDAVTLPAALNIASTSLVWSEIRYDHKPMFGYVLTGTLALKDQMYMRPRLTDGCPTRT